VIAEVLGGLVRGSHALDITIAEPKAVSESESPKYDAPK
jgi:hypothetical protein